MQLENLNNLQSSDVGQWKLEKELYLKNLDLECRLQQGNILIHLNEVFQVYIQLESDFRDFQMNLL